MAEENVIFRVPPEVAEQVRRFARGDAGIDLTLEPGSEKDFYVVRLAESGVPARVYAARLLQLPTCVEIQQTRNYSQFVKAGMISRVLFVYDPAKPPNNSEGVDVEMGASTAAHRQDDSFDLVADPTPGSTDWVMDSGLTPPMQHCTRGRFRKAHRFIGKHDARLVSEAERVLLDLMVHDTYEHVVEEMVDAESFMAPWFAGGGDNVTIRYEDGKHSLFT
jgi:TATA-binding protein-associated factor Taf7